MKKTTIYALLCTTIMISGISLTMSSEDELKTPEKIAAKKKKLHESKGLDTPKLVQQEKQKLASSRLSTPSKTFFATVNVGIAQATRSVTLQKEYAEIEQAVINEKVEKEMKKQDTLREEESQKNKELIEKLETQGRDQQESFDKQIQQLTEKLDEASENLSTLSTEKNELESELSTATLYNTLSTQALESLQKAIEQKTQDEARAKSEALALQVKIQLITEQMAHEKSEKEKLAIGIQKSIGQKIELPLAPVESKIETNVNSSNTTPSNTKEIESDDDLADDNILGDGGK